MSLLEFWHAIANDPDADAVWIAEQLEEKAHPHYGPPVPPSILDRVLRESYGPGLRAQLERSSVFMKVLHRD